MMLLVAMLTTATAWAQDWTEVYEESNLERAVRTDGAKIKLMRVYH